MGNKNDGLIFVFEGGTEIYQIKNDGGIELYLTKSGTGSGDGFEVFGTTKEGKWVKYFDTDDEIKMNYTWWEESGIIKIKNGEITII